MAATDVEQDQKIWSPSVGLDLQRKELQKGGQTCSSKSSDSYYVESAIEELRNENLSASPRARLNGDSWAPYFES